jgi:predicted transcriptional regulator
VNQCLDFHQCIATGHYLRTRSNRRIWEPPERGRGPLTSGFSEGLTERLQDAPADECVYRIALEHQEPTRVADVADRADCSKNTVRRHLRRPADIGLLTRVTEDPETFERNEWYFEWRRLNRLSQHSDEEYTEQLRALLAEHEMYRDEYGAEKPGDVDPLKYGDYGDAEQVWLDLNNWEAIRTEIRAFTDPAPKEPPTKESYSGGSWWPRASTESRATPRARVPAQLRILDRCCFGLRSESPRVPRSQQSRESLFPRFWLLKPTSRFTPLGTVISISRMSRTSMETG